MIEDSKVQADTAKKRPLPPNAGKGRPKGSENKITKDLKAAILEAFDQVGGAQYLATQAVENPSAFLSLLARILPKDMNLTLVTDYANLVLEAAKRREKSSQPTLN
jgi:hypothetical protein